MNNYQLYRTNVSLSGQLKWDIILSNDQNTLFISDFNLSPISDNCTYDMLTHNILNNNHQDNVRMYYSQNKGNFYSSLVDANFTHNYPLILNGNTGENIYFNTFDAGCKRIKSYSKYKKQYEFLCPLWLEHVTAPIKFKISIFDDSNNNLIASKTLVFDISNKNTTHDKFVNYFTSFIQYAGIQQGNDDVLNINFKNGITTISGLNVKNGTLITSELFDIVSNIIHRERPLLEVDNMLMNVFKSNEIVCKQLFNFNLCFNIDDILTGSIGKLFVGKNIIVSVDVYMGNELLEKRDFYTNYENINKSIIGNDKPINVLGYLCDNENITLIDKNKFCQNICHWSLCNNNDYIFNVYEGFSGVKYDNGIPYVNEHQYANSPNLILKTYNPSQNTIGWINTDNIDTWSDFYDKYITNIDTNKTNGIYINDYEFINNVKYNHICKLYANANKGFYLLGIKCSDKLIASIVDTFNCESIYGTSVYILPMNDLIIILTNNYDNLSFGKFVDILDNYITTHNVNDINTDNNTFELTFFINDLFNMLKSVVYPQIVKFDKSLLYHNVDTPYNRTLNISEKVYIKNDTDVNNYVVRYDGKIKPTFISIHNDKYNNILYYKDCISDSINTTTTYSIYNKLGEPLYPSIDYCAIKSINNWNYNALPLVNVTATSERINIFDNVYEYKWFNTNKCLVLKPNIAAIKTVNNVNDNIKLDDILNEIIADYYDIIDNEYINYIKSLYTYSIDWDYLSDNNINNYKYYISLELK